MFHTRYHFAPLFVFLVSGSVAFAGGKNVAVIDNFDGDAPYWCQLLAKHGHVCTVFPLAGPTVSLFDLIRGIEAAVAGGIMGN